jgi:V/A-type H+-transporting ATPase subunit K
MVTLSNMSKKVALVALMLLVGMMTLAPLGYAAEGAGVDEAEEARLNAETVRKARAEASTGSGLRALGLALGAGIAIAGAGIATSKAQAAVGAGGTGAITEKPELFGNVLILFAIPETIVVFGFVIAIMLVLAI